MRWYWWLTIFAVIGMLVAVVIRLITPTPPPVPITPLQKASVDNVSVRFSNIKYEGPGIPVPKELPIAKLELLQSQSLEDIAERLNAEPHPRLKNLWKGQQYTLSYLPSKTTADITNSVAAASTSATINTDEAVVAAQQFISEYIPTHNQYVPQTEAITYLRGQEELVKVSSASEADVVMIPFSPVIESYPVQMGNSSAFPISAFVNRNHSVTRLNFSPQAITYTLLPKAKVLTIEEALTELNEKQNGTITSYVNTDAAPLTFRDIAQGTMTSAVLEYRADVSSQLIYPYYRFRGTVTNEAKKSFQVEIITPAVTVTR